jgi:hypothetical protein
MKKRIIIGVIMFVINIAVSAQVGPRDRQFRHRIHMGISSGELNRYELRHLYRDQRRINKARRRALADGMVGPFERRRINRMRRDENRDIYRFRHNRSRQLI